MSLTFLRDKGPKLPSKALNVPDSASRPHLETQGPHKTELHGPALELLVMLGIPVLTKWASNQHRLSPGPSFPYGPTVSFPPVPVASLHP